MTCQCSKKGRGGGGGGRGDPANYFLLSEKKESAYSLTFVSFHTYSNI